MPRYRFNAQGPDRCLPDYDGLELSDAVTARSIAWLSVRQLADELSGLPDHVLWSFRITDQDGRPVTTIPLSQAAGPDGGGRA